MIAKLFNRNPQWKDLIFGFILWSVVILLFAGCLIQELEERVNDLESNSIYKNSLLVERDTIIDAEGKPMVREIILRVPESESNPKKHRYR